MTTAINPTRLKALRELRGLTQTELARRVGVSPAAISQFERADTAPAEVTLDGLCLQLGVPQSYLLELGDHEAVADGQVFFRRMSRIPKWQQRQIREIGQHRQEVIDLIISEMAYRPVRSTLPCLQGVGPVEAAQAVREQLGMVRGGPVANMVAVLENMGVFVHVLEGGEFDGIDALSFRVDGTPVVLLNRHRYDPYRWRFDAGHELKHLVCDEAVEADPKAQERDADRFAAEFLVPLRSWSRVAPRSPDPQAFRAESERWRVSIAALLRRNRDAGALTANQYRYAMMRYSKLGWRRGEPPRNPEHAEHPQLIVDLLATAMSDGLTLGELGRMSRCGEGMLRWLFAYELDMLSRHRPRPIHRERPAEPMGQVLQFAAR